MQKTINPPILSIVPKNSARNLHLLAKLKVKADKIATLISNNPSAADISVPS